MRCPWERDFGMIRHHIKACIRKAPDEVTREYLRGHMQDLVRNPSMSAHIKARKWVEIADRATAGLIAIGDANPQLREDIDAVVDAVLPSFAAEGWAILGSAAVLAVVMIAVFVKMFFGGAQ